MANELKIGVITASELIQNFGSPLYVYDAGIISQQYQKLRDSFNHSPTKIYYACKTNTNVEILKLLKSLGTGAETVSQGEIEIALEAGFPIEDIIFTCSNIGHDEIRFVAESGVMINFDSLGQIEKYGKVKPGSEVSLRLNLDLGAGGHSHLVTGGAKSKFGIHHTQIDDAKLIAQKYNLKIIGLHQHIGSNILDEKIFIQAMNTLLATAKDFSNLKFLDFGGGFGVPYHPDEQALDIATLGQNLSEIFSNFCKDYGTQLQMRFEPGRYLVAESGTLLTTVTDIKTTPGHKFIGLDTGMNHLIRPAMYGSFHQIVNATNLDAPLATLTVGGNICESGDILAEDRILPSFEEGDIAAIKTVGAHGYVMASNYNSRLRPAEVIIENGMPRLIRERI